MAHKVTGAELQPAMKYTDIASTPQEFIRKLNRATVIPATAKERKRNVVAHVIFND